MKLAVLFTVIFFVSISFAMGQKEYIVSVDDRNSAMQFAKEAILDIKNKDYDSALNKLMKSIEADSVFKDPYLYLYQLCTLDLKYSDIIIKAFTKGKRVFGKDDELFFYCGEIYKLNAIYDKAILEYTNAMEYAKTNGEDFYLVPYYYLNRGNLYLRSEQFTSALNDYNYLLKLDPVSTGGLTNRGTTYYKLGEKGKACQDWDKAIKTGSKNADEYYQKYCKD